MRCLDGIRWKKRFNRENKDKKTEGKKAEPENPSVFFANQASGEADCEYPLECSAESQKKVYISEKKYQFTYL